MTWRDIAPRPCIMDQQGITGIFADVVKELARQSGIAISNSMAPKQSQAQARRDGRKYAIVR